MRLGNKKRENNVLSIHAFLFKILTVSFRFRRKAFPEISNSAIITIITGMLVYILDVSRLEAAILFMAVMLVFAMEIMNTAIEI